MKFFTDDLLHCQTKKEKKNAELNTDKNCAKRHINGRISALEEHQQPLFTIPQNIIPLSMRKISSDFYYLCQFSLIVPSN